MLNLSDELLGAGCGGEQDFETSLQEREDGQRVQDFLYFGVPSTDKNVGECYASAFASRQYPVSVSSDTALKVFLLARGRHYSDDTILADDFRLDPWNPALVTVVHQFNARLPVPQQEGLFTLPDNCLFFCSCDEGKMLSAQDFLREFRSKVSKSAGAPASIDEAVASLRGQVEPFGDFSQSFCRHTSIVHQYSSAFHSIVKLPPMHYCSSENCGEHPSVLAFDGCRTGDQGKNKQSLQRANTLDADETKTGLTHSEKAYLRVSLSLQNDLIKFLCHKTLLDEVQFLDLLARLKNETIPRDAGSSPDMRRFFQDECKKRNKALANLIKYIAEEQMGKYFIPAPAYAFFSSIVARGVCCFVHFTAPVTARCLRKFRTSINAVQDDQDPASKVAFLDDLRAVLTEKESERAEPLQSLEEFRASTLADEDEDASTARKKHVRDVLTILPSLRNFLLSCVLKCSATVAFTEISAG